MALNDFRHTLNCDMGEGLDAIDEAVMPYIDCASIACGGHAGNESSMRRTIMLATEHSTIVGAHPAYPDRENFGRKSLKINPQELTESLKKQTSQLIQIAEKLQKNIEYIKPHGALYNDCTKPENCALDSIIKIAIYFDLPLIMLAGNNRIISQCKEHEITLIQEAFADRAYQKNGELTPRTLKGSVLTTNQSLKQAHSLFEKQGCPDIDGDWINLQFDTLCVHSDTHGAEKTIREFSIKLKKVSQNLKNKNLLDK